MPEKLFIPIIMERVTCEKHGAPLGVPCFHLFLGGKRWRQPGICDARARKAGFVGNIREASLQTRKP
jgi:hypothetical protein